MHSCHMIGRCIIYWLAWQLVNHLMSCFRILLSASIDPLRRQQCALDRGCSLRDVRIAELGGHLLCQQIGFASLYALEGMEIDVHVLM